MKVLPSTQTMLNTLASNELTIVNNSKVAEVRIQSQLQDVECMMMSLEDNHAIVLTQLKCLMKPLSRKQRLRRYDDVMSQYLFCNHDKFVRQPREIYDGRVIYYMPHNKPLRETSLAKKLAVRFGAPSHAPGCKALNDSLETGPSLNPELLAILVCFRWHSVVLKADIEKAFL